MACLCIYMHKAWQINIMRSVWALIIYDCGFEFILSNLREMLEIETSMRVSWRFWLKCLCHRSNACDLLGLQWLKLKQWHSSTVFQSVY